MADSESQRGRVRGLSLLEVEEFESEGCTDVKDDVPAAQDEDHEAQQLVLEPEVVVDPGGNALGLSHTLHGYHVIVVICTEQAWVTLPLQDIVKARHLCSGWYVMTPEFAGV